MAGLYAELDRPSARSARSARGVPSARRRAALISAAALALLIGFGATHARAEVVRYAVIVGHNTGEPDEQRLRFAETDAARVSELLKEVGGVPAENQVVLRGTTAARMRRALTEINDRIRAGRRAGESALLLVYYSGHGDADALHLGDTRFPLRELEELVRGSAARVRLLVIDSCRSGSVTRVKGGRPAPPVALSAVADVASEGLIVLTASTAGEDAQESDHLGGSFFTHYLLSALRGAADTNNDQVITLAEAYSYAHDQTLAASMRTMGGPQHPTFRYDLRGREDIPLAELGSDATRGQLTVPAGSTWLILRDAPSAVVGEIVAGSPRRTLSLRPGKYQVRARTRDALLEGTAVVVAGGRATVDPATLRRTSYTQLARKGRISAEGHAVFAAPMVQTAIVPDAGACFGGVVGWTWLRSRFALSPRLAGCGGTFGEAVEATDPREATDIVSAELRIVKIFALGRVRLDLGAGAGGSVFHERFDKDRGPRYASSGYLTAGAGAWIELGGRLHLYSELSAQLHLFRITHDEITESWETGWPVVGVLGVGARL